jgi:hypothetical protein
MILSRPPNLISKAEGSHLSHNSIFKERDALASNFIIRFTDLGDKKPAADFFSAISV